MSNLLNQHGSRIKSIYLELKNYRFYHSPSKQSNPDKRFIGRKEMIKKLKSLITQSETNSGTYLVTGFRGMGKTSLVNQVLSELFDSGRLNRVLSVFFFYIISIWIATFFSIQITSISSFIGIYLFLAVLVKGDEKYRLHINKNNKDSFVQIVLKKYWLIIINPYMMLVFKNNTKKTFAYSFINIASILLGSNIILYIAGYAGDENYKYKMFAYFGMLILYFFFTFFSSVYYFKNFKSFIKKVSTNIKDISVKSWLFSFVTIILFYLSILLFFQIKSFNDERKPTVILTLSIISIFFLFFTFFRNSIKDSIHAFINHNNIIPIRINLGKESLTEEDILRLLSYGLYTSYKKIAKPFGYFKRTLWSITIGLLIYLIGSSFYFFKPTYQMINDLRVQSHITEFFPSQSQFNYTIKDHKIVSIFNKLEKSHDDHFLKRYYNDIYKGDESIKKQIVNHSFNDTTTDFFKSKYKTDKKLKEKKWWAYVIPITVAIDYAVMNTYNGFTKPFIKEGLDGNHVNFLLSKSLKLDDNFRFIPRFDYLFFLYFFIFYFFAIRIVRMRIWGTSHKRVLNRIEDLIENLEANVSIETNRDIVIDQFKTRFSFLPNKKKEFPIKSAREIEIILLEILTEIESISQLRMRPKFVFIFDELDKIQPKDVADNENSHKEYTETEWTKKRQDTIGTILTNLKHFFNSAKAKFIFIAGREMYDAALADISDRDALIGSLFHEVIYVHSFYKDPADERLSDITSMTERYICQFLIPEEYNDGDPNLKKYHDYLKQEKVLSDDPQINEMERTKIILTLHNFISYVSYRSNGAPKKITKIFEEYLQSYPLDKKKNFDSTIITKGDTRSIYLHFGYLEQYIFSVGRYLFNPFVIAVNKYIRSFEDKLLVSTAFLLNHIYKFHKVGFSYKTFELTPEIIAIYKAPELRDFINRLITFLKQTHIRRIISGLYDFKFHSKIEKEISYISKISETESAAFNFTLDESLVIKSIFRSKLKKIRNYWGGDIESSNQIDSIAFINANLGDLNYNDNKYFEAIHYYKEALLSIKKEDYKKQAPDSIIFWIRTELKHGLSHEMIRNTDEALMIYNTISEKTEKYISYCHKKNNKKTHSLLRENAPLLTILRLFYQPLLAKIQLIEKSTIKSLTKIKLEENINNFKRIVNTYLEPEQSFLLRAEYYNKLGDLLFYKNGIPFGQIIDTTKQKNEKKDPFVKIQEKGKYHKSFSYSLPVEGYRKYMISLASLINVGILEKYNIRGIFFDPKNPKDSELLILHFFTSFLFQATEKAFPITRSSFLLAAANSLSDAGDTILTFASAEITNNSLSKNELLNLDNLYSVLDDNLKINKNATDIINATILNDLNKGFYGDDNGKISEDIKSMFINDKFNLSETHFKNTLENIKKGIDVNDIFNLFEEEYKIYCQEQRWEIEKNKCFKTKCDEVIIIQQELNQTIDFYTNLKKHRNNLVKEKTAKEKNKIINFYNKLPFNRFHIALRYIYISAEYFLRAGDYKEYTFQITKILHIIKAILKKSEKNSIRFTKIESENLLNFINEKIVYNVTRYTYKSYKNFDEKEYRKIIDNLDAKDNDRIKALVRTSTSAAEDLKEILLLYKEIELHIKDKKIKIQDNFISPYINVSLGNNRILELNYKNSFNYKLLKQFLKEENYVMKKNTIATIDTIRDVVKIISDKPKEEIEYIILDSLFTLYKMHQTLEIFGLSYIHNHSWYASVYKRLGFWSQLYKEYSETLCSEEKEILHTQLEKLIGKEEINDLNPISFYEKALTHSYRVYETHTEGSAYLEFIDEMNYLDDDFNDNLYHFSATMERITINFGMVINNIESLNNIINAKREKIYAGKYFYTEFPTI